MISTINQMVIFLGKTVLGATHDYTLLKKEFPTEQEISEWFKEVVVWIDLSYLGFAKDYSVKKLNIPYKKPRKSKNNPNPQLTDAQKSHNKATGRVRVNVENAIGGVKRYDILKHKFRNKSEELRDKAIFLAAGLWNWTKGFSFSS